MIEEFGVRNASGVSFGFPRTARPGGDWGTKYDVTANRAAHLEQYWLEGTGQSVPDVISLVMEVDTENEQLTEDLIRQIVSAARQAVILTRTGQPDRAVLGLQSWATGVVDEGDSSVRRVTLTWWPAAPGQDTGFITPAPAPTAPTLTVYLSNVSHAIVTITQGPNTIYVGDVISGQGIAGLVTGQTYTITGAPISGYTTPEPRTFLMEAGQRVMLAYYPTESGASTPTSPDTGVY